MLHRKLILAETPVKSVV